MIGVQPCDFAESPVSRNILVFTQPTTPLCGPPALVHSVLLASWPKYRWCVEKQVSTCFHWLVFGSYTGTWRRELSCGATLAQGWSEPFFHKSGLRAARTAARNP